jgi:hypothetical protein
MSESQVFLDQDLLVAFVDGELPSDRAAAVEAALIHDAEAWETVRLLRLSASAATHALGPILDEPVPGRLLRAAGGGAGAGPIRVVAKPRPPAWHWSARIAAGVALVALGLGAGYVLRISSDREPDGGYSPAAVQSLDPLAARFESVLLAALDRGGDGESFAYDSKDIGKGRIDLGKRFTTAFGADCREFRREETRGEISRRDDGLACRDNGKDWSVMIMTSGSPGG